MPRVYHVKSARKKNPVADVGESYYWWKFAFGPKRFSKTYPKRSQLTQSSFLSQLYDLEDGLDAEVQFEDCQSRLDEIVDTLNELMDECQSSLDNMPEHLQDTSDSGITLTERIDALESAISDYESIEIPEEPGDWEDEIQGYNELDKDGKSQTIEEWKEEKVNDFMQELQENFPIVP